MTHGDWAILAGLLVFAGDLFYFHYQVKQLLSYLKLRIGPPRVNHLPTAVHSAINPKNIETEHLR